MKKTYSNEELVQKLELAQQEIARLKSKPDQTKELNKLREENAMLFQQTEVLAKQRDDLLECLNRHNNENKGSLSVM